jgi:hypothetical protein
VSGYNEVLNGRRDMHEEIRKVIACQVVMEELLPLLPKSVQYETLEYGLHVNPDALKAAIQERIDASIGGQGTILLGYGLCSRAVVGLRSKTCSLVVPRTDDCIGIFLGSREAYLEQALKTPGTYYLTKGWIEAGDNVFGMYDKMVARYGAEKAEWLMGKMLRNYTRLVLINTGQYDVEQYREYSRKMAFRFHLRFEEIAGSTAMVSKLLNGPWGDDFVTVAPGEVISYEAFY